MNLFPEHVEEIKLHPLFLYSPNTSAKTNQLLAQLVTELVVAKALQLAHKKSEKIPQHPQR
jgi:hypothetical protein